MAENLYEDLKNTLQDFKDFLEPKMAVIKPAVQALAQLVPRINDLISQLIELLGKVKTEIQNLNVGAIQNLDDVSQFTQHAKDFLTSAKTLLPEQAATIDEILGVADVVGSLPTIDQVKGEITSLIDALVADLNQLKS